MQRSSRRISKTQVESWSCFEREDEDNVHGKEERRFGAQENAVNGRGDVNEECAAAKCELLG